MASEVPEKHREEFSSFLSRKVVEPIKASYRQLIDKSGGKPKGKTMARRADTQSLFGGISPEAYVAQQALIQAGIARGRRNTRIELGIATAVLTGVLAVGAYALLTEQLGVSVDVSSQDNIPPSVTAPAPAEVVKVYTATPTGFEPTATPLPPTAAFVPVTATAEATARPPATERVRPTEKPLPGELFRLDCTGMPWSKCWETLVKTLEPWLGQDGVGGQSFSTVNELRYNLGEAREPLNYVVKRYYSPKAVGIVILNWIAPGGETRSDEIFVFNARDNGKKTSVPVLPLSGSAGAYDNSVGIFWEVETASASGAVMTSNVTTSRELAGKLFEEKRIVHNIAVVQKTVNFQLGDPAAEFLYSQPGSPEKGIQPIKLVVEFGLKPSP